MKTGIYQIRNVRTSDCYIGSVMCARGFSYRWNEHRRALRGDRHHSIILQHAFAKYGENCFIFEAVEVIERPQNITNIAWREMVLAREQYYLDSIQPKYNVAKNARSPWTGQSLSDAHKAKISANHADVSGVNNPFYGKKHSEKTRIKFRGPNPKILGENNPNSKLTDKQRREVLRLGAMGVSERQRAKIFKVSRGCIRQTDSHVDKTEWLKVKHPTTKLTIIKIRKIKQAIAKGYSDQIIASKFSVSRRNINCIRHKKTWRHV